MLKLSTHIEIEYIKQSDKLQKLGSMTFWGDEEHVPQFLEDYNVDAPCEQNICFSIADIIDNAEQLFGDEEYEYARNNEICGWKNRGWKQEQEEILGMCQQNKSINEISEHIIKNIK